MELEFEKVYSRLPFFISTGRSDHRSWTNGRNIWYVSTPLPGHLVSLALADALCARIVHWKNTGAAFGIFQGFGNVFTILAIIVSIAILYYFPQVPRRDWTLRLAMGLQLGGAIGNLIDRLLFGSVTDFISLGNFAVFNVADASISIGVAILVLGMLVKEREGYLEERERLRREVIRSRPTMAGI